MPRHEDKNCPRCERRFECKVGSILLCQCSAVKLSASTKQYIETRYDACLCVYCLRELNAETSASKARTVE